MLWSLIGNQHTVALYGNQCCPEVMHDISHHIKHRAYVYAWVHVHSRADDDDDDALCDGRLMVKILITTIHVNLCFGTKFT